jgi:hypothetical protein
MVFVAEKFSFPFGVRSFIEVNSIASAIADIDRNFEGKGGLELERLGGRLLVVGGFKGFEFEGIRGLFKEREGAVEVLGGGVLDEVLDYSVLLFHCYNEYVFGFLFNLIV